MEPDESGENEITEDEAENKEDDGIITTEEEIAGYRIVKAIACSDVIRNV